MNKTPSIKGIQTIYSSFGDRDYVNIDDMVNYEDWHGGKVPISRR